MKKILFSLFAIMALAFTSCDNKAGLPGPGDPVNIAGKVQGVYEGTWTRSDGTDELVADGEINLVQVDDQFYIVNVVSKVADPTFYAFKNTRVNDKGKDEDYIDYKAMDLSAKANINPRYVFFNVVASDYGNEFSGKVVGDNISMSFNSEVKLGRKSYIFSYTFSGTRK